MATGIDMMDSDATSDKGPYATAITSNINAAGASHVTSRPSVFTEGVAGRAPRGGINYVEQDVGGIDGPRGDVFAAVLSGIRGARTRFARFNGDFIGTTVQNPNRVQGPVGKSRNTTAQRATSQRSTNLPDNGAVTAAFTNPALSAMLTKIRGK